MKKSILIIALLFPLSIFSAAGKANHLAVFGGATTFFVPSATYATAGADYEYILGSWGVGVFFDAVFATKTKVLGGPAIFLHPVDNLNFYLAPAIEVYDGKQYYGGRVSANYSFHSGSLSYGPAVSADYFDGHVSLVYGLVLGFGF